MKQKKKLTAGDSMLVGAKSTLAFARGEPDHGCRGHLPAAIDVKAIREQGEMSQSELAHAFGFSTRTLSLGNMGGAFLPARLARFSR